MDIELTKAVLPALGGFMALVGGVFTFVNGRLNEAKTSDGRSGIVAWKKTGIVVALNAAGIALGLMLHNFLVYLALSSPAFLLGVVFFAQDPRPPTRRDIVRLCGTVGAFAFVASTAICLHFVNRIMEILEVMQ